MARKESPSAFVLVGCREFPRSELSPEFLRQHEETRKAMKSDPPPRPLEESMTKSKRVIG